MLYYLFPSNLLSSHFGGWEFGFKWNLNGCFIVTYNAHCSKELLSKHLKINSRFKCEISEFINCKCLFMSWWRRRQQRSTPPSTGNENARIARVIKHGALLIDWCFVWVLKMDQSTIYSIWRTTERWCVFSPPATRFINCFQFFVIISFRVERYSGCLKCSRHRKMAIGKIKCVGVEMPTKFNGKRDVCVAGFLLFFPRFSLSFSLFVRILLKLYPIPSFSKVLFEFGWKTIRGLMGNHQRYI